MFTVLEIGCGEIAGPFYEGATEHIVLDTNEEAVAMAARNDTSLTPMVGDARRLRFDDESIDVVLARNVFGDPSLGMRDSTKRMAQSLQFSMLADGDLNGWRELRNGLLVAAVNYKNCVVSEVARVLKVGGSLVVVEQLTPHIASEYFATVAHDPSVLGGLIVRRANLTNITPPSYANHHAGNRGFDRAWVAIKRE